MADTTVFNIQGPTVLSVRSEGTAGASDEPGDAIGTWDADDYLGYTSNEDMISVSFNPILVPHTSTQTGGMPAAMIYHGVIATVTATLVKWSPSVKEILVGGTGATEGAVGRVGMNMFDNTFTNCDTFRFRIDPVASGSSDWPSSTDRYGYLFQQCWLETWAETDWGNAPKKLVLTLKARATDSQRLYTRI